MKEVIVIRNMNQDYEDLCVLNQVKQQNQLFELEVPEYIKRNPVLMAHLEEVHSYILKYSQEFGNSVLAPPSPQGIIF